MSWMDAPLERKTGALEPAELIIHAWNCQCGDCGYGGASWADSPALKGKPILTQESRECPGCGVKFTHSIEVYTGLRVDFQEAA